MLRALRILIRFLFPLMVLAGAIWGGKLILESARKPKQRRPPRPKAVVKVMRVRKQVFQVILRTSGTVKARTESTLIPEVSGKIVRVSPEFRAGGFFEKGDVLLEIDPRDYEAACVVARSALEKARLALETEKVAAKDKEATVAVAAAELARARLALKEQEIRNKNRSALLAVAKAEVERARLALEEEKARARQALENWQKLGRGEPPGDLVLREPQLRSARAALAAAEANAKQKELDMTLNAAEIESARAAVVAAEALWRQRKLDLLLVDAQIKAARAAVEAAEAELAKKKLDLERTRIRAPYAGRILTQNVDVGHFVSPGTVLAEIYAVDYVETRLPLSNRQLGFVNIPELYRGEPVAEQMQGPLVVLKARKGLREHEWRGRIVRAEGAIDVKSRQLFVIAQVKDPYGKTRDGRPPLRVGTFVNAEIYGHVLQGVFVLPRAVVREGRRVLIVNSRNELVKRDVNVIWSDKEHVVVREGIEDGDLVCLTPIVFGGESLPVETILVGEDGGKE